MSEKFSKPSHSARNRAARLLAVQAVYQSHFADDADPAFLTAEYAAHRAEMEIDGEKLVAPDLDLLRRLIFGVIENRADINNIITQNRSEDAPKLEPLLQACLLCGVYELTFVQATDYPIIISDYVDVAKSFYDGKEPGLVNAILDSVRKVVRE